MKVYNSIHKNWHRDFLKYWRRKSLGCCKTSSNIWNLSSVDFFSIFSSLFPFLRCLILYRLIKIFSKFFIEFLWATIKKLLFVKPSALYKMHKKRHILMYTNAPWPLLIYSETLFLSFYTHTTIACFTLSMLTQALSVWSGTHKHHFA